MSNRLTAKEIDAAIAAIEAMLAGGEHEGDWPSDVSSEELKGASEKLKQQRKRKARAALKAAGRIP